MFRINCKCECILFNLKWGDIVLLRNQKKGKIRLLSFYTHIWS